MIIYPHLECYEDMLLNLRSLECWRSVLMICGYCTSDNHSRDYDSQYQDISKIALSMLLLHVQADYFPKNVAHDLAQDWALIWCVASGRTCSLAVERR